MTGRLALLALVGALLAPASADALTLTGASTSLPYQTWVDAAHVRTPAGTVELVEGPTETACMAPLKAGCTDGSTIWLDELHLDGRAARNVLMHEVGHLYALQTGRDFHDETFADDYAFCATHPRPAKFNGKRLRGVCRSLRPASAVSVTVTPAG